LYLFPEPQGHGSLRPTFGRDSGISSALLEIEVRGRKDLRRHHKKAPATASRELSRSRDETKGKRKMEIDRTPGYVNQLTQSIDKLTAALDAASDASRGHARSLAWATWALVLATVVLVIATAIHAG
jgi:hypothetical protein